MELDMEHSEHLLESELHDYTVRAAQNVGLTEDAALAVVLTVTASTASAIACAGTLPACIAAALVTSVQAAMTVDDIKEVIESDDILNKIADRIKAADDLREKQEKELLLLLNEYQDCRAQDPCNLN
jgi:hypothetical protein